MPLWTCSKPARRTHMHSHTHIHTCTHAHARARTHARDAVEGGAVQVVPVVVAIGCLCRHRLCLLATLDLRKRGHRHGAADGARQVMQVDDLNHQHALHQRAWVCWLDGREGPEGAAQLQLALAAAAPAGLAPFVLRSSSGGGGGVSHSGGQAMVWVGGSRGRG